MKCLLICKHFASRHFIFQSTGEILCRWNIVLYKSISNGDCMCSCKVQLDKDNPRYARLAQENGFGSAKLPMLLWLVKGTGVMCTRRKECTKYDLTAAQYFWLAHHNDWSRWFAVVVPYLFAVPVSVLWVGLQKSTQLNLDVKNIFSGSHTEQLERCSKAMSKYARKFLGGCYVLCIHIDYIPSNLKVHYPITYLNSTRICGIFCYAFQIVLTYIPYLLTYDTSHLLHYLGMGRGE